MAPHSCSSPAHSIATAAAVPAVSHTCLLACRPPSAHPPTHPPRSCRWGRSTWRPWLLSLALDLLSMKLGAAGARMAQVRVLGGGGGGGLFGCSRPVWARLCRGHCCRWRCHRGAKAFQGRRAQGLCCRRRRALRLARGGLGCQRVERALRRLRRPWPQRSPLVFMLPAPRQSMCCPTCLQGTSPWFGSVQPGNLGPSLLLLRCLQQSR